MSEVPMTHLPPEATWAGTMSGIGDPTLGFVFFGCAILLGTLLIVANRTELSVARARGQGGPAATGR